MVIQKPNYKKSNCVMQPLRVLLIDFKYYLFLYEKCCNPNLQWLVLPHLLDLDNVTSEFSTYQ